jgi:hypothetical protein
MGPIFVFYFILSFWDTIPKKIIVDVERINQLNVLEIAGKITAIPLKNFEFRNPGAEKVFLIKDKIYILQRYREEDKYVSHVVIFDNQGNNKGMLETKDPTSDNLVNILDMHYDNINNIILLIYSTGYGKFDENGKMLSFNKYTWNSGSSSILIPTMFIFKSKIFFEKATRENDESDISLVSTDLSFRVEKAISLPSLKTKLPGIIPALKMSAYNGDLYISLAKENKVYKFTNGTLSPIMNIVIKGGVPANSEIHSTFSGKYLKIGYWSNRIEHDFLYDIWRNIFYNLRYIHDQNMVYSSGIKDDYFNTGYLKFNPTNLDDCIYFLKTAGEIKGSKLYDPKQPNTILFLVKLK